MLIDIVFSLDSIITAVGMARDLPVMIIAVVIAVAFMMFFSGAVGNFIDNNPSIKILALSFLVLIGIALVAEGLGWPSRKATSTSPWPFPSLWRCSISACVSRPPA